MNLHLPWQPDSPAFASNVRFIRDAKGKIIGYLDGSLKEAKIRRDLILRAVNQAPALAEALKSMLSSYDGLPLEFFDNKLKHADGRTAREGIALARTALKAYST